MKGKMKEILVRLINPVIKVFNFVFGFVTPFLLGIFSRIPINFRKEGKKLVIEQSNPRPLMLALIVVVLVCTVQLAILTKQAGAIGLAVMMFFYFIILVTQVFTKKSTKVLEIMWILLAISGITYMFVFRRGLNPAALMEWHFLAFIGLFLVYLGTVIKK